MSKNRERVQTIGFSLVSKLSVQLWVRSLGLFLLFNLLFLAASGILLLVVGERQAAQAVRHLQTIGLPSEGEGSRLLWPGLEVKDGPPLTKGLVIPELVKEAFPPETRGALRSIDLPREAETPLFYLLDGLQYRLELDVLGSPITIIVGFTSIIWVLKTLFVVLIVAQLLTLFRTMITRAELIRKVLRPISDLAQQTQSLSQDKGPLSVGEMQALAGTLDEINAARLDTRIDLDSTQDELKNLAVAINGLLERINQSYRLQARFVSDASHELRTPIAAIQGYANLLDRWGKNDPAALQESIDALKEEAANMKDLVEQLLFLARGDNNTMHIDLERFDLGNLAETIYRETEMIDGGHIFKIETEEAFVLADQGLVKQACRILVDNAIKYTPAGGTIRLVVSTQDKHARFAVQDSGIGIPPGDIPYIFDRFYRADESRARATGGTGLGLSIAKWIAERHGGYLEVISREDFGSRISLVLPQSD
ncbi:MAG: ATP-binding protein [Bacillota bacterium]|jgi:signal transduction histidine kinase|nr:ATP-binding protein [Bacillota bacterium]HHT89760.1 HAMP domain-containing protein [Bacillota bacterium]